MGSVIGVRLDTTIIFTAGGCYLCNVWKVGTQQFNTLRAECQERGYTIHDRAECLDEGGCSTEI